MIRINLLPVRVSKRKLAGKQQLLLFGLVIVLGLLLNSIWSHSRAQDLAMRQAKLKRTKDDIAQLDRIIGEVKNIKAQQNALKEKLDVLEKLKAGRAGPVRMLDELASITPKKLWLKKIDEKGGSITFVGTAVSIEDVSLFMSALKGSRYFAGVELKKTAAAKGDGRFKVVDFTISANANYTPGVQLASASAPPSAKR